MKIVWRQTRVSLIVRIVFVIVNVIKMYFINRPDKRSCKYLSISYSCYFKSYG